MKLLDFFTESKSGDNKLNEDGIYSKAPFTAVIDGTTSKDNKKFGEASGGRLAMQIIRYALDRISAYQEPYELISEIDEIFARELIDQNFGFGPSAGIVIYNEARRELISYGDNPYSINGKEYYYVKESDRIAAQTRASVIKKLLDKGVAVEEIQKNDLGRKEIINYLKEISEKYANVECENGYPVINGKGIVKSFITVHKIDPGSKIILASDGYPKIMNTHAETEAYLQSMLKRDILCIDELQGTKGVAYGNVSFDDRSYVRFIT